MLRQILLALSRNLKFRDLLVALPATRAVVDRFVAGDDWAQALPRVKALVERGLYVTVDVLGEDTTDLAQAEHMVGEYIALLDNLAAEGLTDRVEVSIKPTALGLGLPDGAAVVLAHAQRIVRRAVEVGTTVTVDMEDHNVTETTVELVEALRADAPDVACVLQSSLKRTEQDCARLDAPQSRVRLCKGAYAAPAEVAFIDRRDVDINYVRCLRVLMRGEGRPLVATHDPDLIEIAQELAARTGRGLADFEFQMLYGIRGVEQERLADLGHTVRVYVPFGPDWYGYFVRRMAERPANLTFFLRSFLGRK
ncbi:MAG: proline dehydrogenase family protein [Propionibacteriaceae bacterium]|jgi:proline dehydrogenase|nr:proline dehydrogenase family protein [Propionibacteriaceae bacterium]